MTTPKLASNVIRLLGNFPVSQVAGCTCTLLAGNSTTSVAVSEVQINFSQQSPKMRNMASESFSHALLLFLVFFFFCTLLVVLCKCLRQLVAGDSDQLESLISFGRCAHSSSFIIYVISCSMFFLLVMYGHDFCSNLMQVHPTEIF